MRLLLTDDHSRLGAALARALAADHEVRILDDPRDREAAAAAVADREAVVCLVPTPLDDGPEGQVALDRATRGTYNLLTTRDPAAPLPRLVLVSSLAHFDRYPADSLVDEAWAPWPTTSLRTLVPYLAELTAREVTRVRRTETIVLRLGAIVGGVGTAPPPPSSLCVHIDDAVRAVGLALALPPPKDDAPGERWRLFHIDDGGADSRYPPTRATTTVLGYVSTHRLTDARATPLLAATLTEWRPSPPLVPIPPRPIRRVLMLGAGGPLGAVAAAALARDFHLRLADIRPLGEIAVGPPQSPGAPLPRPLGPPHEECLVDVTDQAQVVAAAEGMDAILNLTVMRRDPDEAFRVNLLGALNVMRAADRHSIRRVVQTGPVQMILDHPAGYGADFGLPEDAPSRPGDDLYFLSKFLGQELVRVFAEERGGEVPCLLFGNFVDPALAPPADYRLWSFTLSWADAGAALARAIATPSFPRPFQVLHPNADLPHGRYPNAEAKRLLGWRPKDRLEAFWRR